MKDSTYTNIDVIEFSKKFVCLEIDAEKGEGVKIAKKYKISGYPTILFTDSKGNEIDRTFGTTPDEFLTIMKDYYEGKNTLSDFLSKKKKSPKDIDLLFKIASKYSGRGDIKNAEKYYNKILKLDPNNEKEYAEIIYSEIGSFRIREKNFDLGIENFEKALSLSKNKDRKYFVYSKLVRICEKMKLKDKVVEGYERWLNEFPDSAQVHNGFAWFCATNDMKLDSALKSAQRAVELSEQSEKEKKNKAMYLDTLAEVYYRMKDYDKAIEIEKQAIELINNDEKTKEEFKERLEKFEKRE